jgi:hypothetical protein
MFCRLTLEAHWHAHAIAFESILIAIS